MSYKEWKYEDILSEIAFDKEHKSVFERYFTPYYSFEDFASPNKTRDAICVAMHTNKLALITLAPSHPVISEKKTISTIDFKPGATDRLENAVKGKRKKGAQRLDYNTRICIITCSDGSQYTVVPCIRGKLLEVNSNLITDPNLLVRKPTSEGFIALMLVDKHANQEYVKNLKSQIEYDEYVKSIVSSESENK